MVRLRASAVLMASPSYSVSKGSAFPYEAFVAQKSFGWILFMLETTFPSMINEKPICRSCCSGSTPMRSRRSLDRAFSRRTGGASGGLSEGLSEGLCGYASPSSGQPHPICVGGGDQSGLAVGGLQRRNRRSVMFSVMRAVDVGSPVLQPM